MDSDSDSDSMGDREVSILASDHSEAVDPEHESETERAVNRREARDEARARAAREYDAAGRIITRPRRHSPDSQDASGSGRQGHFQAAYHRRRAAAARIVDDEASEAGSEDSSRSLGWRDGREQWTYLDSFPRFMELPAELRRKIWEEFCPDLVAKARIFAANPYQAHQASPVRLEEAPWLRQQTAPTRTLMLVHRETQALVFQRMPDSLVMNAPREQLKTLRLNYETDIIDITGTSDTQISSANDSRWFGLNGKQLAAVQNLAVTQHQLDWFFGAPDVEEQYPGIKTLFIKIPWDIYKVVQMEYPQIGDKDVDADRQDPASLCWCLADAARQVRQTVHVYPRHELDHGFSESFEEVFCWPNPDKIADFGAVRLFPAPRFGVPLDGEDFDHGRIDFFEACGTDVQKEWAHDRKRWIRSGRPTQPVDAPTRHIRGKPPALIDRYAIWPLVHFDIDDGVRYFDALREWNEKPEDWIYEEEEVDSRRESDEYESEGIDDGDIEEDGSSEEEDDLAVQPLSDQEDAEDDAVDCKEDEIALLTNQEPIEIKSSESEAEAEDDEEEGAARSKRKRANQPAPARKRRAVALDSEDEDAVIEVQIPTRKRQSRGYTVISDDDEGEDEDDEDESPQLKRNAPPTVRRGRKAARMVVASSDREEAGSESESDYGTEKRPMSLMDKLRLGREQHPIPVDDSNGDSDEEGHDAADFPQAKWSDEEEEDDEDRDGDEETLDREGEVSENSSE